MIEGTLRGQFEASLGTLGTRNGKIRRHFASNLPR